MRLDLLGHSYGGSTRIFRNGVDLQVGLTAGNPQVWNGAPLFQGCNEHGCKLYTHPLTQVDPWGQSHLFASAGADFWAAELNGYRDSQGLYRNDWFPLAVDSHSARAAVVDASSRFGVYDGSVFAVLEPTGPDLREKGDVHFCDGVLGWRKHGILKVSGKRQPVQIPASGVRFSGDFLLAWQNGRGLVLHSWDSPVGLVLSPLANYNADVRFLDKEKIVVVAGINDGDEGEHRYEVNWTAGTVNGERKPWVDLSTLPVIDEPVPVIGRYILFGFFEFGAPVNFVPHNCSLRIGGTSAYVTADDGVKLLKYLAVQPEGDLDALDKLIAATKVAEPLIKPLPFWTSGAQAVRPPNADDVGIQANLHKDESTAAFEARLRASCRKVKRAILIGQCYTSNSDNTQNLRAVVPVIARIARDEPNVAGIILFHAGPDRHDGWDLHPEVWDLWREAFAGIPNAPIHVTPPVVPKPIIKPIPVPIPKEAPMPFYAVDKPLVAIPYEVVPQGDGVALKRADGKFMEVDAFGQWKDVDAPNDGDAKFKRGKTGGLVAADRGGDKKCFVIEGIEA